MEIHASLEFEDWLKGLSLRFRGAIESRVSRIEEEGHFGDCKYIGNGVSELRWKNGLRIYFVRLEKGIFLLNGGDKNGQKKDIKKAKVLIKRYAENEIKK